MASYWPSEDCNTGEESGEFQKGAWSIEEDRKLLAYIERYGIWNWNHMAKPAGLARSGKSCRLRWMNYLKPNIKHGNFTIEEEETIIRLQRKLGNRWAAIAGELHGRTDNEIKNYWNTHLKKRVKYSKEADVVADYRDISNITVSREPSSSSSGTGGSGISGSPSPSGSSEECCMLEGAEMFPQHTSSSSLFDQVGNFTEQNPLLTPAFGGLCMTPEEDFQEAMFMISEAGGFRYLSNSNTQETLSSEYFVYDLWGN